MAKANEYKVQIQDYIPIISQKISHISPDAVQKLKNVLESSVNEVLSIVVGSVNNIWHYTLATLNVTFFFFLVPVISFYMLRDWKNGIRILDFISSERARGIIKRFLFEMDKLLSGYIRGQLNVCILLCIYYCTGLWLVGFEFALLLGVITSFAVIVPFIGFAVCFCVAMVLGYLSFGITFNLLYVIIIYITGSILETSILSPKIIGDRIGINPLWIIFTVLAAGKIFGPLGLLFAIPIAGVVKIVFGIILESLCDQSSKVGNTIATT
jgi:putative permease